MLVEVAVTRTEIKQWVLNNLYTDGKIRSARMKRWSATSPYWVEKHFPDIFAAISILPGRSFSERVYLLMNDIAAVPVCKCCNNCVDFKSFDKGHYEYCSIQCANQDQTLTDAKVANKRACGGYIRAVETAKLTFQEKYGVEWVTKAPTVQEQRRNTCLDRYGVENVGAVTEFVTKRKATCVDRYGVEYPIQHEHIHDRALQSGLGRSKVKWTEDGSIWYQGLYEKRFLDHCLATGTDVKRGTQVKYIGLDGKEHRYTPDFIVALHDVYEIKSTWTWDNKGKNKYLRVTNKLKLRAAKKAGFNVFLVIEGKTLQYSNVIKQKELRI